MRLTPWFPSKVVPARIGVYEVRMSRPEFVIYRRWDGEAWHFGSWSVDRAALDFYGAIHDSRELAPWRGLAKKP